jgi:hypothetical protein
VGLGIWVCRLVELHLNRSRKILKVPSRLTVETIRILTEILTYMAYGTAGVREFADKSPQKVTDYYTWTRFHCGNSENPRTVGWLNKLQSTAGNHRTALLRIQPSARPEAAEVETRLYELMLLYAYESIQQKYF